MLLHLPDGYQPEQVRDVLAAKIKELPESLRRSLTRDQGPEMRDWKHLAVDAGIDIYFRDPHSPWQRGTNENNDLLRQYFPEGSDLSIHTAEDLDWVAQKLNHRPRKRLGFAKPIELIGELVMPSPPAAPPRQPRVCSPSRRVTLSECRLRAVRFPAASTAARRRP